jgi:ssDNA-binding Zn-finger/Zn-ribbon topoisomerase 1
LKKDKYNIVGNSDEKCPECGSKMVIKLGRFSPFQSCSNFPKCKGILHLNNKSKKVLTLIHQIFLSKYNPGPKQMMAETIILKKSSLDTSGLIRIIQKLKMLNLWS